MNMDTHMSGSTVNNHIPLEMGFEYSAIRKNSYQSWFLVYLRLLQASTSSTPSCQEIDHSDHHPAIESNESVDRQARGDPFTSETPEELLHKPTKIPKPRTMRITIRYVQTRIQTHQNGCKNSEKILWMNEFLNTETHTQVLLMNHL